MRKQSIPGHSFEGGVWPGYEASWSMATFRLLYSAAGGLHSGAAPFLLAFYNYFQSGHISKRLSIENYRPVAVNSLAGSSFS